MLRLKLIHVSKGSYWRPLLKLPYWYVLILIKLLQINWITGICVFKSPDTFNSIHIMTVYRGVIMLGGHIWYWLMLNWITVLIYSAILVQWLVELHVVTARNNLTQAPLNDQFIIDDFNSSSAGQNGCHIVDDIFRCILVNDKFLFWLKFHLS